MFKTDKGSHIAPTSFLFHNHVLICNAHECRLLVNPRQLQDAQTAILPNLIKEHLVPDERKTLELVYEASWETVEEALLASKNASTFTDYSFVHDYQLQNIFENEIISNEIKEKVWLELANGERRPTKEAVLAATNYALIAKFDVHYDHLNMVIGAQIDFKKTTALIGLGGKNLTEAELRELPGKLDGNWNRLNAAGGEKFTVPTESVDDSFLNLLRSKNIAKTRRRGNRTTIYPV